MATSNSKLKVPSFAKASEDKKATAGKQSAKLDNQTDSSVKTAAKSAVSMADLMVSYKTSFKTFRKGDNVKGKITKLTKNEITVDIEAKSEAIVLEKDKNILQSLLSNLKVGGEVEVTVLNPESDAGNPVVSLRRFMSNAAWKNLEEGQQKESALEVIVTDVTKGGLVVATENGLSGFLPNSHISASGQQMTPGKKLQARILEISRKENKIIFTQKLTISTQAFNDAIKQFKIGDTVEATVINIAPFGIFVTIPVPGKTTTDGNELALDGLIHISEISWEKVEDVSQLYTPGEKIQAKVIRFDKDARRMDLSVKQLTVDPFDAVIEQYPVDKKITAPIMSLDEAGVHIQIAEGVEGLIRKDKIPPTVNFQEGQTINATVSEIDKKRHRIYLVPVLLEKPIGYR